MLEAEVANLLGVEGPIEPLCLCWTGDVKRIENGSQRIEITISGRNGGKSFPLRARTVQQLKLPSQTVDYDELCGAHPPLRKLPVHGYADVSPQLIIGVDNAKLICALKSRESSEGQLVAAKTRLGWCVYGQYTVESSRVEYVNIHVEQYQDEANLHDLSRQYLALDEANGVCCRSDADMPALKIVQETTRKVDGRWKPGPLWGCVESRVPNSYGMAGRRRKAPERKLSKDHELGAKMRKQIAEYAEKRCTHRMTEAESESTEPKRARYRQFAGVGNLNKQGRKKRGTSSQSSNTHIQGSSLSTGYEVGVTGRWRTVRKPGRGRFERTGTTRAGECWRTHWAVAAGYQVSPGYALCDDTDSAVMLESVR